MYWVIKYIYWVYVLGNQIYIGYMYWVTKYILGICIG